MTQRTFRICYPLLILLSLYLLVQQHLPFLQLDLVRSASVVEDIQEPGSVDLLVEVDDGGDDV